MRTKATFYKSDGTNLGEFPLYNSVNFDERLDEQLDTGSIQIISTEESLSFADFCPVSLKVEDSYGKSKTLQFCAFKSREKRGKNYYVHSIELAEPTRMRMGIMIEGKKITQPVEGSGKAKKTLLDVLGSLLKTFETITKEDGYANNERFILSVIGKVQTLLQETISPEFHWEAGTLLWECLCDIANVINAIPRLYARINGEYNWIEFDLINDETKEYEI